MFAHNWLGDRAETWFLDLLCVHPDAQGKGFGRELGLWGVQCSEEEGVCASVICAENKEGFYGKLGFVEKGRANVGVLKDVRGGAIMFRDIPIDRQVMVGEG